LGKQYRYIFLVPLFFICGTGNSTPLRRSLPDTITAAQQQAITYIDGNDTLSQSVYWPNIKPYLFLQNIKLNIYHPLGLYEGVSTNFCGYAALSYLFLHNDPLGYAKLLLQLYKNGTAKFAKVTFKPSPEIMQAAGTLRFKGILDIHPADQLWFLCLADHFKGYLNFFDKHYDDGDEDTFWAAVNYAKFNRMVKKLLGLEVEAAGSDLIHPDVGDLYEYISERIKTGTVVLYLNNLYLYKRSHTTLRLGIPTHYVILEQVSRDENGIITIIYWDYGARSLRQVTARFLRKIIFGISHCTKKPGHAG